jgi:hypothetical protein
MGLWRVEVAGVSHRFVEAEDRERAMAVVAEAILEACDLRVTSAAPVVSQLYEGLGPLQRKRMLAALDGLTSPRGLQDAKRARRRLARQVRYDMATREWARLKVAMAPPIPDPEHMRKLLIGSETAHIARLRQRLQQFGAFD